MANWQYSAWRRQATNSAKLLMLAQHIEEVEERLDVELSADSRSRSSQVLQARLERLEALYAEYEKRDGQDPAGGGPVSRVLQVKMNRDT